MLRVWETFRILWESRQLQLDRSSPDEWHEWMRHLSVALLRESPSPALRRRPRRTDACGPLARRLFEVGFMACWGELRLPRAGAHRCDQVFLTLLDAVGALQLLDLAVPPAA